jgi:hypothetical protein
MKLKRLLENMMMPNQQPMDDHEVEMAITDLRAIAQMAAELAQHLENEKPHELEGWVQAKITKAADYIQAAYKNHMFSPEQDCDTCGDMKEAMEPKSAYGDLVYSNIETLKSAATKIMFKPENYSVLTDGNKFMLTTNRRAGIFAKEGKWKIIGKIDPNKTYRELDSNLFEATSTCCGRCGHKHVKGTSCPKPFLSGKRHCRNRD